MFTISIQSRVLRMNVSKIEENLRNVLEHFTPETFIYELIGAYGKPKASIIRLQKGDHNLSKKSGEVLWKKNLFFKQTIKEELYTTFEQVIQNKHIHKQNPRFIIVSDYNSILAVDTITTEKLDVQIDELAENFEFFLPLGGIERVSYHKENAADIKAAGRMAKIYDEICKHNPNMQLNDAEALNVFLSRLLFCFFAESTQIFKDNLFSETLNTRTKDDGTDLNQYFNDLFKLLNVQERAGHPKHLIAFPYVNGGLFKEKHKIPVFTSKLRKMIIECNSMDWSAINPDIFGSMIQNVVHPDQRSSLGMHYTSVVNIMKIIQPLFLDELYQELQKQINNKQKLKELHNRLEFIKIFDPACGSGNFLIIAYKELRKFEIQLLKRLGELENQPTFLSKMFLSKIQLTNFYGIEIDGFACEIAKLSLWLAEHQMNIFFKNTFGNVEPTLPLKKGGYIVCNNAARLEWQTVCPIDKKYEIYILGNPPYLGTRNQTILHKEDMAHVFQSVRNYKNLDYISCWFCKGADYIRGSNSSLAFVSTSSITQGDQVSLLWPHIFEESIEISFCHQPFKWTNSAKKNAGVSCVIIGLRNKIANKPKFIFNDSHVVTVDDISCYLTSGKRQSIARRSKPISNLPLMLYGSEPRENGHLMLNDSERRKLLSEYPSAKKFIMKVTGSNELINRIDRWCLWITDLNVGEAKTISPLRQRFEKVSEYRKANRRKETVKFADKPYRFASITHKGTQSIIVPIVSSDRREYIPCGFLNGSYVILNSAQVIYDADLYIFGVISSKIHLTWVKATAGKLKNDYRYSSSLSYNTFPFPNINQSQKEAIRINVLNVLAEREKHPEKTLAELYDPKKMPRDLRKAHQNLDIVVEQCYRSKPFERDEDRLEHLFKLYEKMTKNERRVKKDA